MRLRFISASATASLGAPSASQFYLASKKGNATFARVVGPDDKLIDALVNELRKRLPEPGASSVSKPTVVVVSEHDTDYGRGFVKFMEKDKEKFKVVHYSYLREIDGGRGSTQRAAKSEDRGKAGGKGEPQAQLRAHGPSQIDYLARLVQDIERNVEGDESRAAGAKGTKSAETGKKSGGSKDIAAIAIFGNDVYDKLLVLRALRPAFPKAVFMTTDLDARLLDPSESEWTRNLVVATNFELKLDPEVQRGASPFRDGYQTGTYLATWLFGGSCADKVMKKYDGPGKAPPWLKAPLMFEIGRHSPIPLAPPDMESGTVDLSACNFGESKFETQGEVRIQPSLRMPEMPGKQKTLFIFLVSVLLIGMFGWAALNLVALRTGESAGSSISIAAKPIAVALVAGGANCGMVLLWLANCKAGDSWFMVFGLFCAVLMCAGIGKLHEGVTLAQPGGIRTGAFLVAPAFLLIVWTVIPALTASDEPFAWFEGVSIWPTQLLRALAAVLACFSLLHVGSVSAASMGDIGRRYGLTKSSSPLQARNSEGSTAMDLWSAYAQGRIMRTRWTICIAFGYFLFSALLLIFLDARPGFPIRGGHGSEVAALLGFAEFMGIVLLVSMIYACGAFIVKVLRPATRELPEFPLDHLNAFRKKYNLPDDNDLNFRFVECILLVDLVAARSTALLRLIYYPFAVFALMVIARSPLFDNWDTPAGLAIVLGLPFAMVIGCVVWLRVATLAFHEKVIKAAQAELIVLRRHSKDSDSWQLERLFEVIRDERRGSFQNIALQPMVRALLLPIGGFSAIEVIEHLLLPG